MANQRIASALSHQDDTTGFVPSVGYEEGNRSFSTDAIIVDMEASLDCLYGEDVDLDWEQMLAPVELGSFMFEDCATQLETTNASLLSSDTCACEQSTYWSEATGVNCSSLPIIYYYHPDYLGSVEFITDMRGDPYQFFLNTIWGENLQNQLAFNTTAFSSRFRFNGKEWDEETGNFYYGARYYDPKISVWLSVDPLLKHHESPYSYTSNNPIILIDPDGMDTTFASKAAQQRINDTYNEVLSRMSDLEKDLDKRQEKFLNGELSDRQEAKYMEDLAEYRGLRQIKEDFDKIFDENTPCVEYRISADKSSQEAFTKPMADGSIVVTLNSGHPNRTTNEGKVIHENAHVIQLFYGRTGRSRAREYQAFIIQAVYDPYYVQAFKYEFGNGSLQNAIDNAYRDYPAYVGTDVRGRLK